ncbi:MAG: hypothetical protein IJY92_03135 [Alphaproteobacteria bacterium]|nr:hypothetical protein [Alphaproteobacteria bacterium]
MKKTLPFLVILAALVGGVVYYTRVNHQAEPLVMNYKLPGIVKIQHPSWSGNIVNLGNKRAQRQGHSDQGTLQNITPNTFEIVWDKWDIEIYKLNPKTGVFHLFDKKKKPQPAKK